jgi:hypothetical protein
MPVFFSGDLALSISEIHSRFQANHSHSLCYSNFAQITNVPNRICEATRPSWSEIVAATQQCCRHSEARLRFEGIEPRQNVNPAAFG